MTFFVTLLTWLAALFTLALLYDLRQRRQACPAEPQTDALHTCLKALRDADMLDAWRDIPPALRQDHRVRGEAEAAIRAYLMRRTCPIARADCMACLNRLATRR